MLKVGKAPVSVACRARIIYQTITGLSFLTVGLRREWQHNTEQECVPGTCCCLAAACATSGGPS
jgi:hypothetical protein